MQNSTHPNSNAVKAAQDTAKNATALAKAHLIRESRKHAGRWQWVDFPGPNGKESAGVVDILAIRKKRQTPNEPGLDKIKPLDLFDIMLIQVKGGSARSPKPEDIDRMEQVADYYHAGKILLYQWDKKKKDQTGYRVLDRKKHQFGELVRDSKQLFGRDAMKST